MDDQQPMDPGQVETLKRVFADQLGCLPRGVRARPARPLHRRCADQRGRIRGAWPEAARLRELAFALQAILNQDGERDPLCDEFLDLCSIHGESNPGEPRLARALQARIEGGEVGTPTETERKPW